MVKRAGVVLSAFDNKSGTGRGLSYCLTSYEIVDFGITIDIFTIFGLEYLSVIASEFPSSSTMNRKIAIHSITHASHIDEHTSVCRTPSLMWWNWQSWWTFLKLLTWILAVTSTSRKLLYNLKRSRSGALLWSLKIRQSTTLGLGG